MICRALDVGFDREASQRGQPGSGRRASAFYGATTIRRSSIRPDQNSDAAGVSRAPMYRPPSQEISMRERCYLQQPHLRLHKGKSLRQCDGFSTLIGFFAAGLQKPCRCPQEAGSRRGDRYIPTRTSPDNRSSNWDHPVNVPAKEQAPCPGSGYIVIADSWPSHG